MVLDPDVAELPPGARLRENTGLVLMPTKGQFVYRVVKSSHRALNPLLRDATPDQGWHRWDVQGHRTIYAATLRKGAYVEVLDHFARRPITPDSLASRPLSEFFDQGVEGPDGPALVAIEAELLGKCMNLGSVPAAWREVRTIFKLALPEDGWAVSLQYGPSIAALRNLGIDLDLGHLYSESRTFTCALARVVWGLVLDDGSFPHGIHYQSRHGAEWECWAIWLRAIDAGKAEASEPTKVVSSQAIKRHSEGLDEAATLLGLTVH